MKSDNNAKKNKIHTYFVIWSLIVLFSSIIVSGIVIFTLILSLNIDIFDICTIIGNLLNNAIEAYKEDCNNYEIRINLNGTKSVYQIEISNTIKGSVLSGNKTLKTSKSDTKNHGIGIKSVKSRAEKYNGKTEFTEENGQFVARVWLMA